MPADTAKREGAAEGCLSEHEEQFCTLHWLGTLPSGSLHSSVPGLRWRRHGGWVPALLPGAGADGVPALPVAGYSPAAPLQRCLESLVTGCLTLLCRSPALRHLSGLFQVGWGSHLGLALLRQGRDGQTVLRA